MFRLLNSFNENILKNKILPQVYSKLSKNILKNSIKTFSNSKNSDNNDSQSLAQNQIPENSISPNIQDHMQHEHEIKINYSNIKGIKTGDSSHYIIQFTCKKCDFRTTRMFTKRSYHHGIVLIRCEGCEGIHLIADNLGWFDDTSINVEDIITRKGEEYRKLSVEGLFSLSDSDPFKEENNKL